MGDPFARPFTWHPEHNNDRNLAAMVADPAQLQRGISSPLASGDRAATAVLRLRTDLVKPLPDSALAQIVPVASGGSGPPPPLPVAAPGSPGAGAN